MNFPDAPRDWLQEELVHICNRLEFAIRRTSKTDFFERDVLTTQLGFYETLRKALDDGKANRTPD